MNDLELKKHLKLVNSMADKLEKEIEEIKANTEKIKIKNQEIQKEINRLKIENNVMLDKKGWTGITDEEMEWVMNNDSLYFEFPLKAIRELIANEKQFLNKN